MTVTEHGILTINAGESAAFETAMQGALPLISGQPGFVSIHVSRCVERADSYLLLVEWESVEAHNEGFRKSPEFEQWREALHHFYDGRPTIEHFEVVASA